MSASTSNDQPYAVIPAAHASHAVASVSSTSHPEFAGIHDSMRHGLKNVSHSVSFNTSHPVQNRLENWASTRDNLKLNLLRNTYGLGAPAHTLMERKIVAQNPHFTPLHANNTTSQLHLDILNGTDDAIEPADFLTSDASGTLPDMHTVMERRLGI
ncbi:proteasome maturation factor UMP1 [Testicularia cyperi]|uniref:Proteasome maturation factor UMP1 n=1 Tax=Testicularia cyperi TaxID=1882483 RepID=A0A317XR13_9BASI|nr:proteasome maturation factor UMP1 [Testicularia cyperi]